MERHTQHSDSGMFLQTQRKRRHLTQAALGQKVGLGGETIRAYESGKRIIQFCWITPIAAALDLSPEDAHEWQLLVQHDAETRRKRRRAGQHQSTLALSSSISRCT